MQRFLNKFSSDTRITIPIKELLKIVGVGLPLVATSIYFIRDTKADIQAANAAAVQALESSKSNAAEIKAFEKELSNNVTELLGEVKKISGYLEALKEKGK